MCLRYGGIQNILMNHVSVAPVSRLTMPYHVLQVASQLSGIIKFTVFLQVLPNDICHNVVTEQLLQPLNGGSFS